VAATGCNRDARADWIGVARKVWPEHMPWTRLSHSRSVGGQGMGLLNRIHAFPVWANTAHRPLTKATNRL
jgi:hypothetical protein